MRLRELLCKVFEGICTREPGENDEDYLRRCGNMDFKKMGTLKVSQSNGIFTRPVVREDEDTKKGEFITGKTFTDYRDEKHPTSKETEHPGDEAENNPHVKAVNNWVKKNRM